MKDFFIKVFFLGMWIYLPAITISVPVNDTVRRARFLSFAPDDMLQDMFEEIEDPLPYTISELHAKKNYIQTNTEAAVSRIPTSRTPTKKTSKTNKIRTKGIDLASVKNESFISDSDSETFQLPEDYFSYTMSPSHSPTEKSVVVYEGTKDAVMFPTAEQTNLMNSSEHYKVWWGNVGGTIDKLPFLPLHFNVPDMVASMINFLVTYVPLMNQIGNPNDPRLPIKQNKTRSRRPQTHYYDNGNYRIVSRLHDNGRDFQMETESALLKKTTKNKRKGYKKRNGDSKNNSKKFFLSLTKTTTSPPEDTKLWGGLGNDQKETMRVKNMSTNRKRIRVADKEWFNFRNSDINNSPIMIVNVPQRPITQFKIYQNISQLMGSMGGETPGVPMPGVPTPGMGEGSLASNFVNSTKRAGLDVNGNLRDVNGQKEESLKSRKEIGRMVLKSTEQSAPKRRRKLKSKRKTNKSLERTSRFQTLKPEIKADDSVTVP